MDRRAAPDAPRARRARTAGLALLAAVLTIGAAFLLLPLAARGFVRLIELLLDACIWGAMSLSIGTSEGGLLRTIGRASASAVVSGAGSAVLAALVLVAAAAFYGLQRLLGPSEEE